MLDAVLDGVGGLDATVMVATAGVEPSVKVPSNVLMARYLPGMAACARASLVICNGGSGSLYQALAHGVPVLGIPAYSEDEQPQYAAH